MAPSPDSYISFQLYGTCTYLLVLHKALYRVAAVFGAGSACTLLSVSSLALQPVTALGPPLSG